MVSSHVKISMISVTSGLSLKLYLNSLVYHRNIFGSSSKVFANLRKSSDIFGNPRKMVGNVRLVFKTILENLRKSSESGRESSENHQKRRYQYIYIIKRTLHVMLLVARAISHSFAALTREILFLPLEHKIHFFSPPCNILYLSTQLIKPRTDADAELSGRVFLALCYFILLSFPNYDW